MLANLPLIDPESYPQIYVTGVEGFGHHGVFDFERRHGQVFRGDVRVWLENTGAGHSDDLADTLSYAQVAEDIHQFLVGQSVDLLETLAQRIAYNLLQYPRTRMVEVTLHKPQAPISVSFADAGVRLRMLSPLLASPQVFVSTHLPGVGAGADHIPTLALARVVIALGTNVGKRRRNLARALGLLAEVEGVELVMNSPAIRTKAMLLPGAKPQRDFLNLVAVVNTTLSPLDLLRQLQFIESRMGRTRGERWAPRVVDLDLINYEVGGESLRSDDPVLTLPHPRAHQREFVLRPWLEIAPNAVLDGKPVSGLLDELERVSQRLGKSGLRPPMPTPPSFSNETVGGRR